MRRGEDALATDDPLSGDEQLEIAVGLLDRDEGALRRLVEIYGPKIKWILKQKLGDTLTNWDIQSCLTLAAAKAWNAAAFDASKGTLGGWFYTIAFHTAVDMARGEKNEPKNVVGLSREPELPARVPACLAEDEQEDPVLRALMEAVEELGPQQRSIAKADLLAGGEGDAETLAKGLGITKQHVYSYREKYKKALLAKMAKHGHTAATVTPAGRRRQ